MFINNTTACMVYSNFYCVSRTRAFTRNSEQPSESSRKPNKTSELSLLALIISKKIFYSYNNETDARYIHFFVAMA